MDTIATAPTSDYDAIYKELDKLESLLGTTGIPQKTTKSSSKSKTKSIPASLDALLASLNDAKSQLTNGASMGDVASNIEKAVETSKKEIEDREKEIYNALNRMGKAIDKKFPDTLPVYDNLFVSERARTSLDRVIAEHLLRHGDFDVAETFVEEAGGAIAPATAARYQELHRIRGAMKSFNFDPALSWCQANNMYLQTRHSSLEFNIHRCRYIRILTSSPAPLGGSGPALSYARRYLPPFFSAHSQSILPLMSLLAYNYLPASSTQSSSISISMSISSSPHHKHLLDPSLYHDLEAEFTREFCALHRMSREPPLRIVGDLGGGGALAKIEKGKRLILDKKTEWSAADELPIDINVPRENQYHSIFVCPVSKEQSTESNPPMMLTCGHVLAKDSIQKMTKNASRVKCPYCPIESTTPPQRVWF